MRVPEVGQTVLVTWDNGETWHEKTVDGVEGYGGAPESNKRTVRVGGKMDTDQTSTWWYWAANEGSRPFSGCERWLWKPIETAF